MNVKDFCAQVGVKLGMPRDKVHEVFTAIFEEASVLLREGDEFRVPAFGKFYPQVLSPKKHVDRFAKGRGEVVVHDLPERKKVRFDPFNSLHEFVNTDPPVPPIAGMPWTRSS